MSHLEIQTEGDLDSPMLVEKTPGKSTYRMDPGFLQELLERELLLDLPKTTSQPEKPRAHSSLSRRSHRESPRSPLPYMPSRQRNRHVYAPPLKYLLPLPPSRSAYSHSVLRHVPGLAIPARKSYHGSSPAQRFM